MGFIWALFNMDLSAQFPQYFLHGMNSCLLIPGRMQRVDVDVLEKEN